MALVYPDRVRFTSATTGTGSITVGSAVAGYVLPATATTPVGSTVRYVIEDGLSWEIGLGTLTSLTVMARTTVLATSAGNTTALTLSGLEICYFGVSSADLTPAFDKPYTLTQFNASYCDVIYNSTTTLAIANQTYTKIVCNTKNSDAGACYSTSTGLYTFPYTGRYEIVTKVRMDDSAGSSTYSSPNVPFSQGFDTTPQDSATVIWGMTVATPTLGSGVGRNFSINRRVITATAGSTGSMFTYVDGSSSGLCVKTAALTVLLLAVP